MHKSLLGYAQVGASSFMATSSICLSLAVAWVPGSRQKALHLV